MRIRERVVAVVRWLWEPRVAIVTGLVLIAGSTVAIAATWPPTRGTLRPFIVGAALILRGIALPHIRRSCAAYAGRSPRAETGCSPGFRPSTGPLPMNVATRGRTST